MTGGKRQRRVIGRGSVAAPTPDTDSSALAEQTKKVNSLKQKNEDLEQELAALKLKNHQLMQSGQKQITLTLPGNRELILEYHEYTREEMKKFISIAPENTRWNHTLNHHNLKEIVEDYDAGVPQQWPAIGYGTREDLHLLDGQRRFEAMLLSSNEDLLFKAYRILNGDTLSITKEDWMFIVRTTKKVRENSKVELAFEWLDLAKENGWDYAQLAVAKGVSAPTVTRMMKATQVPMEWYRLLPDIYSLTNPQIADLAKCAADKEHLAELTKALEDAAESASSGAPIEMLVDQAIKALKVKFKELTSTEPVFEPTSQNFGSFLDSKAYARRRQPNLNTVRYDFHKLPPDDQAAIDEAIQRILEK